MSGRLFITSVILWMQVMRCFSQNLIELSLEDGLSQGFVSTISQDKNGYIWAGTLNGLNRYDGYQFKTYHHVTNDPFSVAPGEIQVLATDHTGRMWVFTPSCVQYYDTEKDRFETPETSIGTKENRLHSLVCLKKDQLVIADKSSIRKYRVAGNDSRVVLESELVIPFNTDDYSGQAALQCLYLHEDGKLWAGTGSGIVEIGNDGSLRRIFPEIMTSVFEIWYDELHGQVCVQFSDKVVFVSSDQRLKIFPAPEMNYGFGLKGRQIDNQYVLFIGKKAMLWDGISLTPSRFDPDRKIVSGFVDRQQNVWMGFDGSGLMCVKKRNNKINKYIRKGIPARKKPVFDMAGNVWLDQTQSGMKPVYASYAPGDGVPDPYSEIHCYHLEAGLNANKWLVDENRDLVGMDENGAKKFRNNAAGKLHVAFGVNSLPDGCLLLLSASGFSAFFYDPVSGVIIRAPEVDTILQSKPFPVSSIDVGGLASDQGWSWIAGGCGLIGMKPDWFAKTCRVIRPDLQSLTGESAEIRLIFAQTDRFNPDKVWIGTWNGLYKFEIGQQKAERVSSYHLTDNESVFCMAQSEPDNIWLGTLHGLVNYNCLTGESKIFTVRDGLPASEFNRNTVGVRGDGLIVMGTVNGYISFYPSELARREKTDAALITQVNKGTTPLQVVFKGGEMYIPDVAYDSANLMICFSALDFANHDARQYRFRMNSRSQWLYNGYKNNALLVSIPFGSYNFEVQTSLDGSTWSDSRILHFRILPPWWATWWSLSLMVLAIVIPATVIVRNWRSLQHEKHRNELLTQKNKFERMLDESRERLLTNIAHDLKTPITLINGLIDSWNDYSGDEIHEVINTIRRQGSDISGLVNQITDLNRISNSGKLPINPLPIDLYQFIPAVAASYRHLAGLKEINLQLHIEPGLSQLIADENQLKAILGNLLSNAVKFTPSRGSISFSVGTDEEGLYFTVSDTGPGIATEEKEKIFERYYQSQSARGIGGSGIGLSYAAEMAGLLGGRLQLIASEKGVNTGATFRFSLPGVKGSSMNLTIDTPPAEKSDEVPVILVVEDHPEMGEFIRRLLAPDYRIILARDGVSGLENAFRMIPDLIISDVMMPEMSGTELCAQLRADVRTSHIPIILLTARTDSDSVRVGLEKGANLYLTKPFDREQLRHYVNNSLQLARQLRDYYRGDWTGGSNNQLPLPEGMPAGQETAFIKSVNEIIEEHYADCQFNVEKLASLLHISKAQLHRKAGALGGESVGNMIRKYRINKARTLLSERPDLTVSDIAFECGFTDGNYFSTVFSKEYGVAPSAFRKQPTQ
ncbi:MAG: response regulator [Bacteroidota bacterium]